MNAITSCRVATQKNAQFRDVELNRDTNETPHDDSIMQHAIIVIGLAHSGVGKSRQFIPPKRRFWKEEQKMKCDFSKHFSSA